MDSYLEDVLERFIIATVDSPTRYLVFKDNNIAFTKHISRATKTASKGTARVIRDDFYLYTGETDIDLVILPIKISYEIVKEVSIIEGN